MSEENNNDIRVHYGKNSIPTQIFYDLAKDNYDTTISELNSRFSYEGALLAGNGMAAVLIGITLRYFDSLCCLQVWLFRFSAIFILSSVIISFITLESSRRYKSLKASGIEEPFEKGELSRKTTGEVLLNLAKKNEELLSKVGLGVRASRIFMVLGLVLLLAVVLTLI